MSVAADIVKSSTSAGESLGLASDADPQFRRQTALVALGRRAIAPPESSLLIQDAAALIAETLDTDRYGAAELSENGKTLMLRLGMTGAANPDRDALAEHRLDFDPRASLAARALETAHIVVAPKLTKDSPLRDRFLHKQGIRAALVAPLQTVDHSFGVLGAFSSRPREFSPEDMLFAETIAHLVSTTISRDRAQKALDEERRFTTTILATVDALVLTLDPTGRILSINAACQRATGFTSAELAHRNIWNTLLVHDEVALLQAALELVCQSNEPVERETFVLTKLGERRRIRWKLAAKRSAAHVVESIVGTGIDITEQRAAEEKVAQFEAAGRTVLASAGEPTPGQFSPLDPGPHGERRKHRRRAFNFLQRIAPIVGDKLPDRRRFHTIHCQDISSAGFSFLAADPPAHQSYVVALGTTAVTIYLTANIIHVTAVIRDDKTQYLVGCQYIGRANYARRASRAAK